MSEEAQKARDEEAVKSRKGLQLSINYNNVATTIVGILVIAGLNEMKNTHDAVLHLQGEYDQVSSQVQDIRNYLGWNNSTPHRQPNNQVPTQDN